MGARWVVGGEQGTQPRDAAKGCSKGCSGGRGRGGSGWVGVGVVNAAEDDDDELDEQDDCLEWAQWPLPPIPSRDGHHQPWFPDSLNPWGLHPTPDGVLIAKESEGKRRPVPAATRDPRPATEPATATRYG